ELRGPQSLFLSFRLFFSLAVSMTSSKSIWWSTMPLNASIHAFLKILVTAGQVLPLTSLRFPSMGTLVARVFSLWFFRINLKKPTKPSQRVSKKASSLPMSLVSLRMGFREPFKRSEEHTSELQSRENLVCRLLL